MSEFLEYVRRRRAALAKELAELETAERVYRASASATVTSASSQPSLPMMGVNGANSEKKTIKEMVLMVLAEVEPASMTALELLAKIRDRFGVEVARTSLSPQLTRLKEDRKITFENSAWRIAKRNAPSEQSERASD